jgi:hypothetical protein
MTGVDYFMDFGGEILADPGKPGEVFTLLDQGANIPAQLAQRACAVAVGANAERVIALDLQQVCDLVEDSGNIFIV